MKGVKTSTIVRVEGSLTMTRNSSALIPVPRQNRVGYRGAVYRVMSRRDYWEHVYPALTRKWIAARLDLRTWDSARVNLENRKNAKQSLSSGYGSGQCQSGGRGVLVVTQLRTSIEP